MTVTSRKYSNDTISANQIVVSSVVAALVALIINLFIYFLVPAQYNFNLDVPLMGPGSAIEPLPMYMVVMATIGAAIGAGLLLAVLQRFARHAVTIFCVIAVVIWLFSLMPLQSMPVEFNVQATLVILHTITAAVITYTLARSKRRNVM